MKEILINLIKIFIILSVIYVVYSTFHRSSIDQSYLKTIDSLNNNIKHIEKKQDSLNDEIKTYQAEIIKVDNTIQTIKNQKTIIKEYYHEKIISIDGFSRNDIDTFFTNRYGYNQ